MGFASVNDAPIVRGEWTLPRVGLWHANIELDTDNAPRGEVTMRWGNEAWVGTIRRSACDSGSCRVLIVGGVGDLGMETKAQGFRDAKVSAILDHILGAAGQTRSMRVDKGLLERKMPWFAVLKQSAGRALVHVSQSLDLSWRLEADGSLWVGEETWPEAEINEDDLDLIASHGASGTIHLRMLRPAIWPGTTWQGARVSRVEHHMDAGDISSRVYLEGASEWTG